MSRIEPIQFAVITPEREVAAGSAESIVLPVHDGELGVLAGRAPLMCELGVGVLRYTHDRRVHRVFIDGGFAQVFDDVVTVLTPDAVAAGQLPPERVAEADRAASHAPSTGRGALDARTRLRRRAAALRRVAAG